MAVKFSFKSSIVVNGKRYGSAEELPDKLRKAYETAVVTRRVTQAAGRTATKIVVNGKEYASPEEMPVDVRKLYDAAMATMDAQKLPASGTAAPDFPVHHDGVYERD